MSSTSNKTNSVFTLCSFRNRKKTKTRKNNGEFFYQKKIINNVKIIPSNFLRTATSNFNTCFVLSARSTLIATSSEVTTLRAE